MAKRSEPRVSVTFEADEQREIEAVLKTPQYRELLDALIGDLRAQVWRVPRLTKDVPSYNTVVRALMRLGLAELQRAHMMHLYQQVGDDGTALDRDELAAVSEMAADALELQDQRIGQLAGAESSRFATAER